MSGTGWRGKRVKHQDGRYGRIVREFVGFGFLELTIEADDGSTASVVRGVTSSDSGARGWAWYSEAFSSGPSWLPLGDHNTFPVVAATPLEVATFGEKAAA